jgi:serine/threonine-protein kinase
MRLVEECNRLLALEVILTDVLAGKAPPVNNRERLGLGEVCQLQGRYAAAARLYTDAFNADAKLADDLKASHRYNAACAAALAAAGQGKDASKLDDQQRVDLRKQALQWLQADLVAWGKAEHQQAQDVFKHWLDDSDLAPVRDPEWLKALPDDERKAWQSLWADVQDVLQKLKAVKK